jgi:hypothetical protein
MRGADEPRVEDAISKIAALLAAAYGRRAGIRLVHPILEPARQQRDLLMRVKRAVMN